MNTHDEPKWQWLERILLKANTETSRKVAGGLADGFMLAVLVLLCGLIFLTGCSSTCPPPEVITVPEVVEKYVVTKLEPLPICIPSHRVCDQPTAQAKAACIGENVQELQRCGEANMKTIAAHNKAIE